MGRLSLLSFGLFVLPIAVTIALLVGIETYQTSRGQIGLGPIDSYNGIQTNTYCQKAFGVTPPGTHFILNPNQWGTADPGFNNSLCLNITTWDNQTYSSPAMSPSFTATWMYPQGPVTEPVHAFANAKLDMPRVIPVQLSNMSNLALDVKWSYAVGDKAENATDVNSLDVIEMNANVCVDMFLDQAKLDIEVTEKSAFEVMVWLGRWGTATQPIGNLQGVVVTENVNGTLFDLYFGDNSNGQQVYTWVAQSNTTEFVGDIAPLINSLSTHGGPTTADYLGYVAFGSEALWSTTNVTFAVRELNLDLVTNA